MKQKNLTMVKRCHPFWYKSNFFESHGLQAEIPISSMEEAEKIARNEKCCFGYYVFQQEYFIFEGKRFEAKPEKIKSVIFGQVLDIEQIKAMPHPHRQRGLLRSMEMKKQNQAIKTLTGGWLDIEKEQGAEIVL